MTHPLEKQFLVIAGKGGVGRTTVSLAFGALAARRGKKVLVCLCSAPPRYSELLGDVVLSPQIKSITSHLDVVNMEPKASQEEYGLLVLKNRTLHRLIFGSRVVRSFLDAVPGLADWAMLGKASYHALNIVDGSPEYDVVVFDSPATGHGLDILALPRAIVNAVPGGKMRDEALARRELLEDSERCEVIPVTLPEEMPVNETCEFVSGLNKLGMHVERIVINKVEQETERSEFLNSFLDEYRKGNIPSYLLPAAVELSRFESQRSNITRLHRELGMSHLILPYIMGGSVDERGLPLLAQSLGRSLAHSVSRSLSAQG